MCTWLRLGNYLFPESNLLVHLMIIDKECFNYLLVHISTGLVLCVSHFKNQCQGFFLEKFIKREEIFLSEFLKPKSLTWYPIKKYDICL